MKNRTKLLLAILAIVVLLAISFLLLRGLTGFLSNADLDAAEPDPMFAQPAEVVTRPPELDAETTQPPHATLDDYVPEEESPVYKTAQQLGEEAAGN